MQGGGWLGGTSLSLVHPQHRIKSLLCGAMVMKRAVEHLTLIVVIRYTGIATNVVEISLN